MVVMVTGRVAVMVLSFEDWMVATFSCMLLS